MFKAATRRTKGFTFPKQPFEAIIHDAEPLATFVDPALFSQPEAGAAYWTVAIPFINGAAIKYTNFGTFTTEAEAVESGLRTMQLHGWRETRAEAEADGAAEIAHRTEFRADGKPRMRK